MKIFPILYKKTSTGKIQQWEVAVTDGSVIITRFGQVDGKIQQTEEVITEGKNIGRANETTPYDQACAQAQANWTKQLKKGYVESIEDAENGIINNIIKGGILPILAHKYSEQGHKIKYPALAQFKFDGTRNICQSNIDGTYTSWSRTRKEVLGVPHIAKALEKINCGLDILDGELYHHDYKNDFENLLSFIRQEEPKEGHEIVQYHVYDFVDPVMTNYERYQVLENLRPLFENSPIHIVETTIVNDETELIEFFNKSIALGYEGCMVRNMDGLYVNKRSYDLQKVKEMDDDEFKVVDVKVSTKGKMAGKAVFVFELPNGETFDAKMKGSLDDLEQYATNPELAVGRLVTVQFQGYTKYGKPRFPVAVRFKVDI